MKAEIQEALLWLEGQSSSVVVSRIRPIVLDSHNKGRVQSFLRYSSHTTVKEYIWRVRSYYENLSPYLYRLQVQRSPEDWQPLHRDLVEIAHTFLLRKGLLSDPYTWQLADNCATQAVGMLFHNQFPYDTDFIPWAYYFIQTACLKQIECLLHNIKALHELTTQCEDGGRISIQEPNGGAGYWPVSIDLLDGLQQLTANRRQVIVLRYFEGLEYQEIAPTLGKSLPAVHKLHYDATHKLCQGSPAPTRFAGDNELILTLMISDALSGVNIAQRYAAFYNQTPATSAARTALSEAIDTLKKHSSHELVPPSEGEFPWNESLLSSIPVTQVVEQSATGARRIKWEVFARQLQAIFLPAGPASGTALADAAEHSPPPIYILLQSEFEIADKLFVAQLMATRPPDGADNLQLEMKIFPLEVISDEGIPAGIVAHLRWGDYSASVPVGSKGRAAFPTIPLVGVMDWKENLVRGELYLILESLS